MLQLPLQPRLALVPSERPRHLRIAGPSPLRRSGGIGIAHVLESETEWGHARLCSTFLLPVMNLNRQASSKWSELVRQYGLDEPALWNVLQRLFTPDDFAALMPLLRSNWTKILRDPSTRTNGALIRIRNLEEIEHQVAA